MYGIIPRPLWEKKSPPDPLNRIELALRLWLIQDRDRLILIDTGIGDYHGETFDERFAVNGPKNPISACLDQLSLTPEQITDVVITHLHFDHVGGLGIKKDNEVVPLFPNARLHLHREHLLYSQNPTKRDRGSFHDHEYTPLINYYRQHDQLIVHQQQEGVLIELAGTDDTLNFICSHGHTPWLMHPYTKKYIYLADILPTAHHIPIPWVMGYDIAPGQTTKDKELLLSFIVQQNLTVLFEHDIDSWGATIEECAKRGYKAKETRACPQQLAHQID